MGIDADNGPKANRRILVGEPFDLALEDRPAAADNVRGGHDSLQRVAGAVARCIVGRLAIESEPHVLLGHESEVASFKSPVAEDAAELLEILFVLWVRGKVVNVVRIVQRVEELLARLGLRHVQRGGAGQPAGV